MRPLGLAWILLAGCAPCPTFDEITIEGGDRYSRSVVRDALDQFAMWTGREGVCVDTVRLEDDLRSGEYASLGGYHSFRRLIELRRRQPNLGATLVHELCHAVDHQDGVVKGHRGVFRYDPAAGDYDRRSRRSREQEAMALTCEAGPEALAVAVSVGAACRPDVDLDGVRTVLASVYPDEPERIRPIALERQPIGAVTLPEGWTMTGSQPVGAGPDGELVLLLRSGPSYGTLAIDPYTGELVDPPARVAAPAQPPPPPTYLWKDVRSAGFHDGVRVVTFSWRLASGQTLHPLIVHDGETWRLPDEPCGSPTTWLVEVDGAPWVVELQGDLLTWSELREPPARSTGWSPR